MSEPGRLCIPLDLLRLKDATIQSYLQEWRLGGMTWEQMLLELTLHLHGENQRLAVELAGLCQPAITTASRAIHGGQNHAQP